MWNGFPNIRHMRVFLETVRTGSVSAAAESCHLSQPAASQAIARLEADIGVPLLNRQKHSFGPTPSGRVFEQRASQALAHLRQGAKAAMRGTNTTKKRQAGFDLAVTAAQLRTLVAIANTGSFTLAASALGLSQPTIHRAARSLEALAKTPFFMARPSGVALTPVAETFVKEVKLAQSEIRQGIEEISQITGEDKGTFVLGSLPLARTSIVPKAIHAMTTSRKGVQVRIIDGRYSELLRSLREGDVDCLIGALRSPHPAEDVVQKGLFRDELSIVAHPNHPLASQSAVSLQDTLAYPWVAPPKETPAGQYLFETLRIQDLDRSPVRVVSSSMAVLRGVLSEGNYVSIVSRHQIGVEARLGLLAPLNVALQGHVREIGLTYRKGWRPTATQEQFIDFLHKYSP